MDNQEKLAIFGKQETGWKQIKQKQSKKYNSENKRDEQRRPHQKQRVNPDGLEGQTLFASYKTRLC
jgi:hypothetical protein